MKARRLVVVSNRLPNLKSGEEWKKGKVPSAGGLVSALLPVMESSSQGLWVGWSGKSVPARNSGSSHKSEHPLVTLIGMDLSDKDVDSYYNGFCNRTLWPLHHCFQGRVSIDDEEQEAYLRVNEKFADLLIDVLEPNDVVWVHDYHMVPLGRFLRSKGFTGPMGFFLHIPFPPLEMIELLFDPLELMDSWIDYDVVGFHTDRYEENYFEVMERLMLGIREGDQLVSGDRRQKVLTSPIGIEPRIYDPSLESRNRAGRRRGIRPELPECKVLLGVDRLDYTKGVPERMESFEFLLRYYPEWRRRVALIQVCSPSRTRVKEYRKQRDTVDALVGHINGIYAEHDWVPIRYLYRTYGQAELARFYRDADAALITPLRDGMNLVAMEYVAAQHPEAPGIPILSRFTGVAEYLSEAVLVNPYLHDSVAEGIERALTMPVAEKKERHQSMMKFISKNTARTWADNFIRQLLEFHQEKTVQVKSRSKPREKPDKKNTSPGPTP